ncbi:hypothetical protein [Stutzerimonas stutzeri]|uniref:hypothetical protein n=1 Tax=Stutzerimonas stutzeri TaxID=316 RepID=UPI001F3EC490|nr:hypothetical protein [Stutzerimonas stutzeri]MCQ4328982.1 hypothetical protein [Stutzerimonas stutzeri]
MFVEVRLLLNIDFSGLSGLATLLNSMALLIALSGGWLLVATRWRRQLAANAASLAGISPSSDRQLSAAGTQRIDRFFYGFAFSSLALAWLLSALTRLA